MKISTALVTLTAIWGCTAQAQEFGVTAVRGVCDAQFGDDQEMVDKCYEAQHEDWAFVRDMRLSATPLLKGGIDRCSDRYWPDWTSIRFCAAGQLEVSFRISRFVSEFIDSGGSELLMGMIIQACEADYHGRLQQIDPCLRNTLAAWLESHPLDDPDLRLQDVSDEVARAAQAAEAAAQAVIEALKEEAVTSVLPPHPIFDPANFNLEAVTAAINASSIDAARKTQFVTAATAAQHSPTLLPEVLMRIQLALGF